MEISICEDEGQFSGLVQEAIRGSSGDGFSFNSVLILKKNLTETFNQQVSQVDHVPTYEDTMNPTVTAGEAPSSASIAIPESQISVAGCSQHQTSKRPPLATAYGFGKDDSFYSKKLAVYLRIRPLPLALLPKQNGNDGYNSKSKKNNSDVSISTIEVLEAMGTRAPTTIRTYPPSVSNVYKVNVNRQQQGRDHSAYAKEFNFDRVLGPEMSQKTVYSAVAATMIQDVLQGVLQPKEKFTSPGPVRPSSSVDISHQSALLFSYGITNAGKTHTVLGDVNSTNQASWGLIPRAIADVFDRMRIVASTTSMNQLQQHQHPPNCELFVSFFEIYNEQVYDLMPASTTTKASSVQSNSFGGPPDALKVRECRGQIVVRGLAKHRVENVEHGIHLTKMAHNKRHTSSNNLNTDSSRSHFICQMHIAPTNQQNQHSSRAPETSARNDDDSCAASMSGYSTDEEVTVKSTHASGTIWIVDLAGSERSKRTGVGSTRQKESTQINKSLMILMRCLNAIKDHSKHGLTSSSVVPFRESKLTHIFMNHLASKSASRTAMVVNVSPSVDDFDETQHVLAYASKARLIEMKPEDYLGKRRQFGGPEDEDAYGLDGRKKKQKVEPSTKVESKKPSLFARMAKNLTPKRGIQKRTAGANKQSKEANIANIAAQTGGMDGSLRGPSDIEIVRKALAVSEAEANSLRYENSRLIEEMRNKEHQIRTEVSMEMEERLRETRVKHQEKLESLRSQIQRETSKTEFTVSMNNAEDQLEELLDRVDESEKEMVRMTQQHRKEVETLQAQIASLQNELTLEATQSKQVSERVRHIEKELESAYDTIRSLQTTTGATAEVESMDKNSNMRLTGDCEDCSGKGVSSATKKVIVEASVPDKPSTIRKRLRPRKILQNSTNQTAGA